MNETLEVNGLKTVYLRKCRTGKPLGILVFLHGWKGSSETWETNIEALSRSFDCIAVDMPGFGISEKPNKLWEINEYAQFVRDFSIALKLPNFVLVGKSFGGRVAILYASKWPNTLSHLVLVSAAGLEGKSAQSLLKITLAKVGKIIATPLGSKTLSFLRDAYYKAAGINRDQNDYKWEAKKLITSFDLTQVAQSISVPTLIVWGDNDKILPLSVGTELKKRIKNSRLMQIHGGHNAHQESASEFNRLVETYIKGLA